jgi:Zn finger protein HypA/HybF involved in hydrogenase expression
MNTPKKYTKEQLESAMNGAHSMAEIVRRLGLNKSSGTYNKVQKMLDHYDIKISYIKRARNTKKYLLEEIFCKNSTYDRTTLRNRIIKEGILEYKCQMCKISNWNDKALSLQLDHINGIRNDNRLENLQFLCPNCHSQCETWGSKNRKY